MEISLKELSAATTEALTVLQYLLPGFLVAWLVYFFTEYKRPSQFEQVVQALLALLVVRALVATVQGIALWVGKRHSLGDWSSSSDLAVSTVIACALGLLFARAANDASAHHRLKAIGLRPRRSDVPVWVEALEASPRSLEEDPRRSTRRATPGRWVSLVLTDDRRILGWPKRFPPDGDAGYLTLTRARWLVPAIVDGREAGDVVLSGVQEIMIAAKDVKRIEFLEDVQ